MRDIIKPVACSHRFQHDATDRKTQSLYIGQITKGRPLVSERIIATDGVALATEAFGNPADPPLVLLMGQIASILWWLAAFCRRSARRGRYVIRYDNRETGHSATYNVGRLPYALDDMRALDGYEIPTAHLAGISIGGILAQPAALKHPRRIASLPVISSSPFTQDTPDSPGTSPAKMEPGARFPEMAWSDRARRHIARDYDRGQHRQRDEPHDAGTRRRLAGPPPRAAGATFVPLTSGSHELHEEVWNTIITAIAEPTGG